MIERVQLKYFKKFRDQSFDLKDTIVLAGPNNAGKTTLFQAIATWYFAFREWEKKKGGSPEGKRTGVALTRKEFLSVPVQRFNLLWSNASTALGKDEGGGKGAATPRIMEITLEGGKHTSNPWKHTMEFRYANSELIYAKPAEKNSTPEEGIKIIYVPSFSGIETEEKVHTKEYQEWLIGQGKPGDIIRNLLAEASDKEEQWKNLVEDVETMFGYRLLEPQYKGRPFILCEYLPGIPPGKGRGGFPMLEIASAGSGFLQTLLLLSFFYARPSTVLLIDEPDAHLHVVLQKNIYDHLHRAAMNRDCQMIVATHSEVIIDNTAFNKIISFYTKPHKLIHDTERDEVREALKRLTPMDILQSERKNVLYVENNSDFDILWAWVKILDHPLKKWFSYPYYISLKGNHPSTAKDHFFALRAVNKEMAGVLLLDGHNKKLDNHDIAADKLKIMRWMRYEIENYLIHPDLIKRFAEKNSPPIFSHKAMGIMSSILPPIVLKDPLGQHEYLENAAASKSILPNIFPTDTWSIEKTEYYKLAEEMKPEEIHPEIKQKLDKIHAYWKS